MLCLKVGGGSYAVDVSGSVHTDRLEEHRPAFFFSNRPDRTRFELAEEKPLLSHSLYIYTLYI